MEPADFADLNFDDALLECIEIRTQEGVVELTLNPCSRRNDQGSFDSLGRVRLRFGDVTAVRLDGGSFELNNTVIGYELTSTPDGHGVRCWFRLTGGHTQDGFIAVLGVDAADVRPEIR